MQLSFLCFFYFLNRPLKEFVELTASSPNCLRSLKMVSVDNHSESVNDSCYHCSFNQSGIILWCSEKSWRHCIISSAPWLLGYCQHTMSLQRSNWYQSAGQPREGWAISQEGEIRGPHRWTCRLWEKSRQQWCWTWARSDCVKCGSLSPCSYASIPALLLLPPSPSWPQMSELQTSNSE